MPSPEGERLHTRHNGCFGDSWKTTMRNPEGSSPQKPSKFHYQYNQISLLTAFMFDFAQQKKKPHLLKAFRIL
jgi:hypothetical protein